MGHLREKVEALFATTVTYQQFGRLIVAIGTTQIALSAVLGYFSQALVLLLVSMFLNEVIEHERGG
jgi:hypothetical protein